MGMKGATAPWNTLAGKSRSRPRNESPEPIGSPGCVWPEAGGTCRRAHEPELALCAIHRKILSQESGECTWPQCAQPAYHGLCAYHSKIANGLIDAPRARGATR
jgi:hypothetical protein